MENEQKNVSLKPDGIQLFTEPTLKTLRKLMGYLLQISSKFGQPDLKA